MKKLLISIFSLVILAFVVVLFVNATQSQQDTPKKQSATTKTENAMPCSATCNHSAKCATSTNHDPSNCPNLKDGKCDPATCAAHKDGKCDPANCNGHKESNSPKCDPANCNGHKTAEKK
ncbi:MAG TPA: hypothetical protein VHO46_16160 [Bacteroidales bacterium]|nr:hypothetical protein [Bacteroidales bacterium]